MKLILTLILIILIKISFAQTADKFYKDAENCFEKKDFDCALKFIEKAISIDSLNADHYDMKAQCLRELNQFEQSFKMFTKAIAINPNESIFYNNRGNLLLNLTQPDYAIADFTQAMRVAKNDSIKHYAVTNRAAAKLNKRDFEGAYEDLMQAYKFDSTGIATLINLGAVCDEIGRGHETLKYLLKVLEINPNEFGAYGNIGFKYQEMGQYEKAIEYFNKVLQLQPDEPVAYGNRGFNKLKLGDLKGARQDIEKSISMYPANSYSYRTRALISIQEKLKDKACEDLQTALDKGFTQQYGEEVNNLKKEHCIPQSAGVVKSL
jgi:tetratricopeptide (TPR) repeat protein